MRGDYSRKTFDRRKHYTGVRMQQGRVQLDADWNEQLDEQLYRTETESVDVIGASGVPKKNGGFKIDPAPGGHDLTISAGRLYVDGLLCELDQPATYTVQPHFPNPDFTTPATSPASGTLALNAPDGAYLVFLDAWQREITARDDRLIREVALGGPDTATRLQTVYQVRLLRLAASSPLSPLTCDTPIGEFDQYTGLSTGTLNARTQPPQNQSNPCVLPPSAGYTRLENQLYRVEVHTPGPLNPMTFKWSRDGVETTIKNIAGNVVRVADVGPDGVLGFAGQQWVEVVDEESTLKRTPHALVQIDAIDPDTREITLKSSVAALANRSGLKLRRWDQSGVSASSAGVSGSLATWIDLEGGIQVSFSPGEYHSGDYWLIPARTVTGEIEWPPYQIPNTAPIPQPPRGIRHHYARLALVDVIGGTVAVREDCREPFPALTEICAEDVCFENDTCHLAGAETVQDAIDRLCQERDLRFHKKHLHGWGIVCGLQVQCGSGARLVTVKKGYAIACEGDDIRVQADETIDLFDLVASTIGFPPASPLASPLTVPDTEVCLILDSNPSSKQRYRVERFTGHTNTLKDILKGTLLLDVFTDCIQSLVDFFKQETTPQPSEANLPVGPTQKRVTTFLNLLVQLWDPNGPFVFLSGEAAQSSPNFEDTILRQFYTRLRAKLQSHTFCAMFDGARQFPAYPYSNVGITTIFSKGRKTRFRVAPGSTVGYAAGAGNAINVFDLTKDEMVAELVFPGGPNVIVRDVALSRNGSQLFAVATLNNKDTMFAIADITGNGLTHTFRAPTLICDVQLVTLGIAPAPSLNVFAIGKGKGLYEINPLNPVNPANPAAPIPPKYAFNGVGHLVIDETARFAYASMSTGTAATDTYTRVMKLNLAATDANPPIFTLTSNNQQLTGDDDIAFAATAQQRRLFVAVNPPTGQPNKHVLVYNADAPATAPTLTNLQQNTTIRLAHNRVTNHLMVSYEDIYRVGMLNPQNALVADFVPVQIGPVWIAPSPDDTRVYVLNYWSNTISAIRTALFNTGQQIPLQPLVTYRAGVLNAFVDLFGGLLQYLKDCFCDHLLVDCPTCGEDDKIYLACIQIKNNKVYKVCNFSHRKYVHSFPTWEYWLSAVPILPFIKKAVEEICCAALPGFFARYNSALPAVPANTTTAPTSTIVRSGQFRRGATILGEADFMGAIGERLMKLRTGGGLISDALASITTRTFTTRPPLAHSDIAGQSVADARQKLTAANVVVAGEEEYDPSQGGHNLTRFATAPVRLEKGARVNLVTKDGKVLFYTMAGEPLPEAVRGRLDASATETLQLRQEVNTLRAELLQVRQTHQADLQARDAQIVALQTSVRDAQASAQAVRDIRDRMDRLERRPPP